MRILFYGEVFICMEYRALGDIARAPSKREQNIS